jgi:hypothetical protein
MIVTEPVKSDNESMLSKPRRRRKCFFADFGKNFCGRNKTGTRVSARILLWEGE